MPVERTVPAAGVARTLSRAAAVGLGIAAAGALALLAGCSGRTHSWEVLSAAAPGGSRVAFVRGTTCDTPPCQSLWIGSSRDDAGMVANLGAGAERCTEIAWTPDGSRVAFLVNGYQLRIYDAATLVPAGQVRLLTPEGDPPARIARGVTFSENGRAVTFDDCPRTRSGCRAGLVAVPQPPAQRQGGGTRDKEGG